MQNLLNRLMGTTPAPHIPELTPAQQEMNTLLETAAAALEQGYHQTALETYERGLTLARTVGDQPQVEHFLSGKAAAYVALSRYDDARPLLDEALALARKLNDARALARAQNNMGSLHAKQEQWGLAQSFHKQALDSARLSGNLEVIGLTLENLAQDYLHQDNPNYAQHLLKEAVLVSQSAGKLTITARVLGLLADATARMDDRINARKYYEQAIHLGRQTEQNAALLGWLQTLARIEIEAQQFGPAIQHFQEAENVALRVGGQSAEFFMLSALDLTDAYQRAGDNAQAEEYATRALAQARSTGNAQHEALALTRLGMTAYAMNDFNRANSFLTEAQELYDEHAVTDNEEHLQILLALSNVAARQNRIADARQLGERLLALATDKNDTLRQAEALHLLGNIAAQEHDHERALTHWQEALTLLGRNTHFEQIAQLRCDIAQLRKLGGDYKAAMDEYEKALVLLNNIKHQPTRGLVLSNAATLYTETGDIDTAQAFYEEAIQIARASGNRQAESLRLGNLGWFFQLTGRPHMAIDRLEQALAISRGLDNTLMIAVQSNNLACSYYQLQDYDTARALHKQAIAAAIALDARRWEGMFHSDMGETLVALNRLDDAEDHYRTALERSTAAQDLDTEVRTKSRLARLLARTGRVLDALPLANDALQHARRMNFPRGIADAEYALGETTKAQGNDQAAQKHYAEAYRRYSILHDPTTRALETLLPQMENG